MNRAAFVQYTNPGGYPPLEHSSRILAKAGWRVLFLGIRRAGDPLTLEPCAGIEVKYLRAPRDGWRQKAHFLIFWMWACAWALRWRAQWIYASDPLSCPVALVLKSVLNRRLVYHEHDSPDPAEQAAASTWMRFVLRARGAAARRADVCVLPNEDRAVAFTRETGRLDVLTVWNCPSTDEVSPRAASEDGTLRVFYQGSIVPARLPEAVVDALALLPQSVSLTVVGYETAGSTGYASQLLARAHRLNLQDRVQVLGPIARRADLLRLCTSCHVGLSLMPMAPGNINERTMFGASNKAFDYMACGLTVLVSDVPSWRNALAASGLARCCDPTSAASIAAELEWLLAHASERSDMARRGQQRVISDWNYERQFLPVLSRMTHAMVRAHLPSAGRAEA